MENAGALESALKLFRSKNRVVRVRAAKMLLKLSDVPLFVLLEILDDTHADGLGAATERVLMQRKDSEINAAMVERLRSTSPFVREVACGVLGKNGGSAASKALISALDDKSMMVRRAAAFGLADAGDSSCVPDLLNRYIASAEEDINVRFAMECALDRFGARYEKHLDGDTDRALLGFHGRPSTAKPWWKLW